MRGSVVVIVTGLVAIATTALLLGRQAAEEGPTAHVESAATAPLPLTGAVASEPRPDVPKAVARIDRPRPAIDRYLSDDRLIDAFDEARHSTHGADLWIAHRMAFDCRLALRENSRIGQVLAGQPFDHFQKTGLGTLAGAGRGAARSITVTQTVATPAQVDAARELRRRCDGFDATSLATYRASLAEIDDRLRRIDDAVGLASAIAARSVPATPDRLRTILDSRDRVAITLLDGELGERYERYSGKPVVQAFAAPSPAMQLVACDLDSDCSPTSRTALIGCIDDADGCGLDVHVQLMRLETSPAQQSIEETRAAYFHAITSGDYGIWGL